MISLGVRRFDYGVAESENRIGQVTGLAWTEVGGELLTVEAVALPAKVRFNVPPTGRCHERIGIGRMVGCPFPC